MIAWPENTHPARLTARLGISELPAAVAVGLLALLQYVFLAQLWRGFPLKAVGDVIHVNVVAAGLLLSTAGAFAIAGISLWRWHCGDTSARRLEAAASAPTFEGIRSALLSLSDRSTLLEPPQLRYTPKNASALEVREGRIPAKPAVVVGLGQRKRQADDPEAFLAQLGHELSHLELTATRLEIGGRRLVILHFRVLSWLLLVFLLVLGFINPRGLGGAPRAWGFDPVWDSAVYLNMSYHAVVLALSSLIILVYSYYFVVRREHLHDFRGSQLSASAVLAERVFAETAPRSLRWQSLLDFVQLHPPASARRRVILTRDFVLLSSVLYPFIVAGAQPLALLLLTGWQDVIGIERHRWNLLLMFATGGVLYLVLCADVVRLGLGALLRRSFLLKIPLYALLAGAATQAPRVVFELVFGLRKGLPASTIAERIWLGVMTGGVKIGLMVAFVLLVTALAAAIRIAAVGEANADRHSVLYHAIGGSLTVGAFAAASMTSLGFIANVLLAVVVLVAASVVFLVLRNRCVKCARRRTGALLLRTTCYCGHEQLPLLRRWSGSPYSEHLTPKQRPLQWRRPRDRSKWEGD